MVAFIHAFHLYDSIQSIKCIHITDITIQISFPFVLTRAVLVESQVLHLNLSIRCCLLNHLKCERINGKFREKKNVFFTDIYFVQSINQNTQQRNDFIFIVLLRQLRLYPSHLSSSGSHSSFSLQPFVMSPFFHPHQYIIRFSVLKINFFVVNV